MQKTWFITGASRGLGVDIARAALAAGDNVVASGRRRDVVSERLGPDGDRLLAVDLDVTDPAQVRRAVEAAVARFGGIDVLVNNAGYGQLGFFEEATDADFRAQYETNFFGALDVTRAALPTMRGSARGTIFNVSSIGGLTGVETGSLYCSSKFALEGFSESLSKEVAPFGIRVVIVEPGPFRTEFLTTDSVRFSDGNAIAAYDDRRDAMRASFEQRNGIQQGDPEKLAQALVQLANDEAPPLRYLAGAMALDTARTKLQGMLAEFDRWEALSLGADFD